MIHQKAHQTNHMAPGDPLCTPIDPIGPLKAPLSPLGPPKHAPRPNWTLKSRSPVVPYLSLEDSSNVAVDPLLDLNTDTSPVH